MDRIQLCARNNALWCDAVCRAHGVPGEFTEAMWVNRNPVPRFHSNLVTIAGPEHADVQLRVVQSFIDDRFPEPWSVKDSFAALDLLPLGFEQLFAASWTWLNPDDRIEVSTQADDWHVVRNDPELMAWEAAWNRADGHAAKQQPRQFPPALLHEPGVAFIWHQAAGKIDCVAIVNATDSVVGMSNFVQAPAEGIDLCASCAQAIRKLYPGRPIVGYLRGDELDNARQSGFAAIHPLRVWIRSVPTR